jgi:outer membrane protein assembly factor BamB
MKQTMPSLLATAIFAHWLICPWLPAVNSAPHSAANASAEDWPQFRGVRGDGVVPGANPPVSWSETRGVTWKVPVTGRGRSSPVLLGERVWLTAAVEQGIVRTRIGSDDMQVAEHVSLRVVCLDRGSGEAIWEVELFDVPNPEPVHWLNSWATPTPVVEAGRVYCDFGAFGTVCLDAETGKVLWTRRIAIDHQVGPGSSPLLWKDRLVLVRDGRDAQYVTALDKNTGETLWKTDRPPIVASSGNMKKSFSTPLLIEHDRRMQLIAPGAHWAVSYDPLTGKELWRVRHGNGFSIGTSPVAGHGLVFFGTGCFKAELWAVRMDGARDVTETHFAWKTLRQVPVMSSPVLVGDELYWVSDAGMANCADARTGRIHWQERMGGPCLASPLAAGGRVYFFRQDGTTVVVQAGTQFERIAENPLEGTLIATPAIAGNTLFLRTDTHLYRIE